MIDRFLRASRIQAVKSLVSGGYGSTWLRHQDCFIEGERSYLERLLDNLEASVRKMETQLEVWTGKIDEFTAAAQESIGWARIDLRQRIDDLKIKRALVRANLDELKAAGRDRRAGLRNDLESAWKDLEAAFQEMKL